ncbi:MAG: SDR family oxidoreductase [Gammaproteobacteria bacterium]|jgi:NAD(P)-dependent dehydrogenase (short-subunit alcohol dehydrogenase family)
MSQDQSTILITGSNRGIGLEFVKQYIKHNWKVIATCRKPSEADELQSLAKLNDNISVLSADITQQESIDSLSRELDNQPIDILINNAAYLGPPDPQKFGDIDYEMFTKSFEVNAIGPIRITEKLIDNVRAGEMKKIIFLGSAAGSIVQIAPPVNLYSYRSSKAALHLAVHNLYHELVSENIMVSLINPGLVDTRGFLDLKPDDPIPEELTKMVPEVLIRMIQEGKIPMITTYESVTQMMNYIDALTTDTKPLFVNCDGTPMPW